MLGWVAVTLLAFAVGGLAHARNATTLRQAWACGMLGALLTTIDLWPLPYALLNLTVFLPLNMWGFVRVRDK